MSPSGPFDASRSPERGMRRPRRLERSTTAALQAPNTRQAIARDEPNGLVDDHLTLEPRPSAPKGPWGDS